MTKTLVGTPDPNPPHLPATITFGPRQMTAHASASATVAIIHIHPTQTGNRHAR